MANTRRVKPIPMKKFIRSLSSPWESISNDLNAVTQVYYPEPNISLPAVDYTVQDRFKGNPKVRTSHRATWDDVYYGKDPKLQKLYKANIISEPPLAGHFTYKNYRNAQGDRMSVDTRTSLGTLMAAQEHIQANGGEPIAQRDGLLNKILDVMMREEYAGAAVEHLKNPHGKTTDVFGGVYSLFKTGEEMFPGESYRQREYDQRIETLKGLHKGIVDAKNASDRPSISKVGPFLGMDPTIQMQMENLSPGNTVKEEIDFYLKEYKNKVKEFKQKYGKDVNWRKASKDEVVAPYHGSAAEKDIHSTIFNTIFPTEADRGSGKTLAYSNYLPSNAAQVDAMWEGLKGNTKRTYTQNLIEDQGYTRKEAAALGLLKSAVLAPSTYATGGLGTVSKGAKLLRAGGLARDGIRITHLEQAAELFDKIDVMLEGKVLKHGKETFTFGKGNKEGFKDFISGGARTGQKLSNSRVASQQRTILTTLTKQINDHIETHFSGILDEMKKYQKAVKTAQDPQIIEQAYVNLANQVASMNVSKSVADTIETLLRQGDTFTEVPLPKPHVVADTDAAVGAVTTAETVSRMSRLKYVESWAAKHAANAARKIKPVARKSVAGQPRVPVAARVMTYTSYMGMSAKQTVKDTLDLLKINDEHMRKTLENYAEYMAAHGDDPTKVITAEDLATSTTLQGQRLVAPEVKAMMDIFDIGKASIKDNSLAKMFKAMGYSDEQTVRALSKYRAALAEDIISNGHNFYSAETRLVDKNLDWAPVGIARSNNAKIVQEAITKVADGRRVVADNVAKAMAETSIRFADQAGTKTSLELRFAGVPLVHLQTPASVNRMLTDFMQGDARIATFIKVIQARNTKWFKGYSQVDAQLNLARTQTIGQGEQIIHAILGELNRLWTAIPKNKHKFVMDSWVTGSTPESLAKYGAQLASLDETFAALESYARGILRIGPEDNLSVTQLASAINKHLPKHFQLDRETLQKTLETSHAEYLSPEWFKDYYKKFATVGKRGSGDLPGSFSALELTWSMRVAMEKSIAESNLLAGIEATWGLVKASPDLAQASWKIIETGEDSWKPIEGFGFKGEVIFPPEVHADIKTLMGLVTHRTADEISLSTFNRATTLWKAGVTVYNIPEYFIRNGISDGMMMLFAGVSPSSIPIGPRVLAHTSNYREALRLNPEFTRAFTLADSNNKMAMEEALRLANAVADPQEAHSIISFHSGFSQANGPTITNLNSVELLKEYYRYGLETNFVRTSLNAVRGKLPSTSRFLGDPIKLANSWGEDARRISLFADGLRLAEKRGIKEYDLALEFAAQRTRKYLFDYSDFSNLERTKLGVIAPFYKWTRKAVPLMIEMLLFKPGKAALLGPRTQVAVNTAAGAPPDGVNYPWIPTVDGVVPSWMRTNPMMYLGDNTGPEGEQYGTYGGIANPFNEIMSKYIDPAVGLLDPLIPGDSLSSADPNASSWEQVKASGTNAAQAALGPVAPEFRLPFEMGTGVQAFGGNELGGRPVDWRQSITSLFPQIAKFNDLKQNVPNTPSEIADTLGIINRQDNTSKMQLSELFFLNKLAAERKKKQEQAAGIQ